MRIIIATMFCGTLHGMLPCYCFSYSAIGSDIERILQSTKVIMNLVGCMGEENLINEYLPSPLQRTQDCTK